MNTAKIKDNVGYVRDMSNRAVVNVNNVALNAYKSKKKKASEINTALEDINILKNDMSEIKQLLVQLINNRN